MTKIHKFSWFFIKTICSSLAKRIKEDNFMPDFILTIKRGGLIPSVIMSHLLNIRDIKVVNIKTTLTDKINSEKIPPRLVTSLKKSKIQGKKILIIDDIVGTGKSLTLLISKIKKLSPKEIKSAIIVLNEENYEKTPQHTRVFINYIGKRVRGWVIFPWEKEIH